MAHKPCGKRNKGEDNQGPLRMGSMLFCKVRDEGIISSSSDPGKLAKSDIALFKAIDSGDPRSARDALSHGACLKSRNIHGNTPLMEASYLGSSALVSLLLSKGADPSDSDCDGLTAVHLAGAQGRSGALIALIKAEAPLDLPDAYGRTPLMLSCWMGKAVCAGLLLQSGASADTRDAHGRSAYDLARENGHDDVIEMLARFGIDG